MDFNFPIFNKCPSELENLQELDFVWKLFFLNSEEFKSKFSHDPWPLSKPDSDVVGYKENNFTWKPGRIMPPETWALSQNIFYKLENEAMKLLSSAGRNHESRCWDSDMSFLQVSMLSADSAELMNKKNYISLHFSNSPASLLIKKGRVWTTKEIKEKTVIVVAGEGMSNYDKEILAPQYKIVGRENSSILYSLFIKEQK